MRTVAIPAMLFLCVEADETEAVSKAASLIQQYTGGNRAVLFHIPGEALMSYLHLPMSAEDTVMGKIMWDMDQAWPSQDEVKDDSI